MIKTVSFRKRLGN